MYYSKKKELFEELNLTRKYLTPYLKLIDDSLVVNLQQLSVKGVAINDVCYNKEFNIYKLPPYLFIVIDTNGKQKAGHYIDINKSKLDFINVISLIQSKDYYVDDYVLKNNLHVIIIHVNKEKFKHFIDGNYHLMYSDSELDIIFPNNIDNIIYQVLKGTKYAKNVFINTLNSELKGLDYITIESVKEKNIFDFKLFYEKETIR